jgi:hypothetical protein
MPILEYTDLTLSTTPMFNEGGRAMAADPVMRRLIRFCGDPVKVQEYGI